MCLKVTDLNSLLVWILVQILTWILWSHLVVSDLSPGPGDVEQRLQSSQTRRDVLHLVVRVWRTQELYADP